MNTEQIKKGFNSQGVQVIARAADILRVLKNDNEGLSLGQIAERVSLPRSTVQRIVNALLAERLVMASSAEGGLRLGPEIQALAAAGRINVAELIRSNLTDLVKETGETVDLSVYRDQHVLFVDQVVGTHRLRTVSAVGEAFPMTNTATGKATLALLDEAEVAAIASQELRQEGEGAKSLSQVFAEIEKIRETGVAFDLDEHTDGISAAAMAFIDPAGAIYSISLPVPSHRFAKKAEALVTALRNTMKVVKAGL
ncbi:MAG: DNA-binding IclR family transcriptional regulator [Paracoccaceae bacterium]|jgi:DNA-binding IclR family transcriptional regulator